MAPESLDAWQNLGALATSAVRGRLWDSLADPARFDRFSLRVGKLFIDFSKQFVTDDVMKQLVLLAEGSNLEEAIEALFAGQRVNATENRAALHTALRAPLDQRPNAVAQPIEQAQAKFFDFVRAVRDARWTGFSGRPIKHVVHIGIGGSQLGPQLAVEALRGADTSLSVRFLANVDGHAIVRTLHGLDPRETLVIVASKSFTTLETGLNAESVKSWFIERTCDPTAMARHFVAVTENVDAASKFGIPPANCFEMWDWVGGRYSLWSAVGLPIALALGEAQFRDMLRGAHAVDQHFRNTPIASARNAPVMLALLGIWNSNFLGANSHAVLAYDHRLRRLPDYLQQLEMESNGKSVRLDGTRTEVHTVPVVWGGEGTNGQHAFHQMLLQGTRAFSADFIVCARPGHPLHRHHDWLIANCLGQSQAMVRGRENEPDDDPDALAVHKSVVGNHANTTIVLDTLDPESFGSLLALYEHKVFCQGAIWQINPFDQWGVELGKQLALDIHEGLSRDPTAAGQAVRQDVSTTSLMDHIHKQSQ